MELETQQVKNIYEQIATLFSDKRLNQWDWIETFINSFSYNSNLLDIGCGNGRNMKHSNYNFYGVDNCENFIKICQDQKLNVKLSDMTKLPFENNCFDGIISIASFHHLSNVERRLECIKEMKRILKPNGRILLSVWSINQTHNKKLNNKFKYGDNLVPWKNNKGEIIGNRYYYIFMLEEISKLLETSFKIVSHDWIHGNEIFALE
jgi:SAM-dependent methyltransferase